MQAVDITVQTNAEPEALQGTVMIVFTEVATPLDAKVSGKAKRPSAPGAVLAEMERELKQARQEARIARDEMQIFQEEARCANEELQSTNEELQSTNEEMQTLNKSLMPRWATCPGRTMT
jgi:chemotaxis protein methyltransferase CheR/two-component system CheB/CheR fusion protein